MKGIQISKQKANELGTIHKDGMAINFKTGLLKNGNYFMVESLYKTLPNDIKQKMGVQKVVNISRSDLYEYPTK